MEVAGLLNYEPGIESVLIVCPASLKINWASGADTVACGLELVAIWNGGKKPDLRANIVIVNYELLGRFEAEIKGRLLGFGRFRRGALFENPSRSAHPSREKVDSFHLSACCYNWYSNAGAAM